MRVPSEAELLGLWERGLDRHPIDRALLLGAWARPDLPPPRLADLAVGALNEALLRLRRACFGSRIDAYLDCESCGARLELTLDAGRLLAAAPGSDARGEFACAGFRFRVPNSRDLVAIAGERDPETAAQKLLERCCMERPEDAPVELAGLRGEVEAGLEALDPAADLSLALACESCGHRWVAAFDAGALLWEEIEARAGSLLAAVHRLAQAYGWSETEILALSPKRRAAYLEMTGA